MVACDVDGGALIVGDGSDDAGDRQAGTSQRTKE